MVGEESLDSMPHLEEVLSVFVRRAKKREFPSVRFTVYLNTAAVLARDLELVTGLCMYGHDVIFDKLEWPDKANLLDISAKVGAPFLQKVVDKICVDLLQADYAYMTTRMSLDTLTYLICHLA